MSILFNEKGEILHQRIRETRVFIHNYDSLILHWYINLLNIVHLYVVQLGATIKHCIEIQRVSFLLLSDTCHKEHSDCFAIVNLVFRVILSLAL